VTQLSRLTLARFTRCSAAALALLLATCPTVAALERPVADPAALPGDPNPSPSPMAQRSECVSTGVIPGTRPQGDSAALEAVWRFSRGEGQTVAIIDTGVQPGPRLPNVEPGGDYVAATDGLVDCDGHGTLVAGIVAGLPGDDGFAGVAPAARLLSIRQTSAAYAPQIADPGDPALQRAALEVGTLARAIVHAADLGARVINVSVATCLPADEFVDQAALGAAVRYAAVDKDAVVVAAAGNAGPACAPNPLTDLSRPDDPRNWAGVTSVAIPSVWQPYVLSVGSVSPAGTPSAFTMAGPWVGVSAPGERVVSVSNAPDGAVVNGIPSANGELVALDGTSYAAARVSGVAALVRSRFPQLSAAQVIDRITRTAQNAARSPSNLVGAGVVDPVAALTWEVPAAGPEFTPAQPITPPAPPPAANPLPRIVALTGVGVLAVAVLGVAVVVRQRHSQGKDAS